MQANTATAASRDHVLPYDDLTAEAARNEVESASSSRGAALAGTLWQRSATPRATSRSESASCVRMWTSPLFTADMQEPQKPDSHEWAGSSPAA